jgi:hypothetical protein
LSNKKERKTTGDTDHRRALRGVWGFLREEMTITFAATPKKFEKERMDYSAFCKDPLENFRKKIQVKWITKASSGLYIACLNQ